MIPSWLRIAIKEIGMKEVKGTGHNPRILEYHSTTTLAATTDEVPWCSSFVNWCIKKSGLQPTRSAAARSWSDWGCTLPEPFIGCLVVLQRGANPAQGHVGFCIDYDWEKETVDIVAGNQSDEVNIRTFPMSDVVTYCWPLIGGFLAERECFHG